MHKLMYMFREKGRDIGMILTRTVNQAGKYYKRKSLDLWIREALPK